MLFMFLPYLYCGAIEAAETNSVVISNVAAATATTGQRKLARAANGDLYAVYARAGGKNQQIYYARSTDNGATWVEQGKVNAPVTAEQKEPAIAIDAADNLYVIWTGKGWGVSGKANFNLQYRKYNQGVSSWDTQESVTDIAGDQICPSVALDSSNNIQLAWSGKGWGINPADNNIQYTRRVSADTDWTNNRESVTDIAGGQFAPALALDSADNLHVAWSGSGWGANAGINNIQYSKRVTASADWTNNRESVTDIAGGQFAPALALDSANNLHVAWSGAGWGKNTGINNIQYRKKTAKWQAQESVTDKDAAQINPSIALDSADNVYVAWQGKGWGTKTADYNIKYSKRVSPSANWSLNFVPVTDTATEQNYPVLLWYNQPSIFGDLKTNVITSGFCLIWTDTRSGIKFYASEGIIWPKVYFVLTASSSLPAVGASSTVTITAAKKDATNAEVKVPGYNVAATVSASADGAAAFTAPSSGNPILLGNANFKAGAAILTLTDTTAQNVTVKAADQNNPAIAGSTEVSFQPGPANKLILNHPADIAAGARAAYLVALADSYNNNVNAGADGQTVYLFTNSAGPNAKFYNASSGGSAITSVPIAEGSSLASFWYADDTPGTDTITASDAAPANGPAGLADARDTIRVIPGAIAGYPVPATSPELEKKQPGELYELLVKVDDAAAKKARKKKPQEDKADYKEGDIVMIKPAGYLWGAEERAKFAIIRAYLSKKQAQELMEPQKALTGVDEKGRSISKIVKKRKYKLDITKKELLGNRIKEFNQLLGAKPLVDAGVLVEKE